MGGVGGVVVEVTWVGSQRVWHASIIVIVIIEYYPQEENAEYLPLRQK